MKEQSEETKAKILRNAIYCPKKRELDLFFAFKHGIRYFCYIYTFISLAFNIIDYMRK